ncbi:MAG: transcription termination/antitermination protein NusA [Candidatus Eisenbacteria sp.]|nr:transcription termination/antitermination protein NusA [Candidatus Eisenbacteria bacterium]
MNYEIIEALGRIAREKNVDREIVLETLKAGLISAARKKYGSAANVEVRIDDEEGELEVSLIRNIVEEVTDPVIEISLGEAEECDERAVVGGTVRISLALEDFGRGAIQAAKQVVIQRVREAEREKVHEDYSEKIGEVVSGGVQQIDHGNVLINLGRTEAVLPVREKIPREQLHQGSTIRALVLDVQKVAKGPQVILSRAHPDFVRLLFQMEVPEILEGVVEIREIAREPGARTKVAVESSDPRVDPVGACVGMKGCRVQAVVRELGGERIDVVTYSSEPISFVSRALSPARVVHLQMNEEERAMTVVVPDDQLSLAIGKGGQNARLAAKLTRWRIDLLSESEFSKRQEVSKEALVQVEDLPGIGPKLAEKLVSEGFETVEDILRLGEEALLAVQGVGEKTVAKVMAVAEAVREALAEESGEQDSEEEEQQVEEVADTTEAENETEEPAVDEEGAGESDEQAAVSDKGLIDKEDQAGTEETGS